VTVEDAWRAFEGQDVRKLRVHNGERWLPIRTAARDLALASYNQALSRAVDIVGERYGYDSVEFYLVDKIIQALEEERAQIKALGEEGEDRHEM